MSDQDDWIYSIIPPEEVDEMRKDAKRLERNMKDGITIVMSSDNQSAIDLVRSWERAMTGDPHGWVKVTAFMFGIVETIEHHLQDEGIDPYEN